MYRSRRVDEVKRKARSLYDSPITSTSPDEYKRRTPAENRAILDGIGLHSGCTAFRPSPTSASAIGEEGPSRRTPEELPAILDGMGLRGDCRFCDFHGSEEITSKCNTKPKIKPEDEILHLPKATRTRNQCIELL